MGNVDDTIVFCRLLVWEYVQKEIIEHQGRTKDSRKEQHLSIPVFPLLNFTLRFITSRGSAIIDNHITDYHNNIHQIQIHKNRLYGDLREAQRLYSGITAMYCL